MRHKELSRVKEGAKTGGEDRREESKDKTVKINIKQMHYIKIDIVAC